MTEQAHSTESRACSPQLGMICCSLGLALLSTGSAWSLLLLLARPRALHSHGSSDSNPSQHHCSNQQQLVLAKVAFASLGGASREEDPIKELY